jgi:hypothetical protein
MLDRILLNTPSPAASQPRAPQLRIRTIDAQNLAKAHRSIGERAFLAAKWVVGQIVIDNRTVSLAGRIFGCSHGSVHHALAELRDDRVNADIALAQFAWERLLQDERDMFVRANLLPVWDSIERITR